MVAQLATGSREHERQNFRWMQWGYGLIKHAHEIGIEEDHEIVFLARLGQRCHASSEPCVRVCDAIGSRQTNRIQRGVHPAIFEGAFTEQSVVCAARRQGLRLLGDMAAFYGEGPSDPELERQQRLTEASFHDLFQAIERRLNEQSDEVHRYKLSAELVQRQAAALNPSIEPIAINCHAEPKPPRVKARPMPVPVPFVPLASSRGQNEPD